MVHWIIRWARTSLLAEYLAPSIFGIFIQIGIIGTWWAPTPVVVLSNFYFIFSTIKKLRVEPVASLTVYSCWVYCPRYLCMKEWEPCQTLPRGDGVCRPVPFSAPAQPRALPLKKNRDATQASFLCFLIQRWQRLQTRKGTRSIKLVNMTSESNVVNLHESWFLRPTKIHS